MNSIGPVSRRDLLRVTAALWPASRLLAWQDAPKSDSARADSPKGDPAKFSTGVDVVNVLVGVRDKNGKIIHDLTKDDFTLEEDGRMQAIKYFAQQTDTPLILGLLVDTSGSQRRLIDQERNASYDFFQHVLREDKDKAFLIHFDRQVELLQDLTGSRRDLDNALHDLEGERPNLNRRDSGNPNDPPPQNFQFPGGGYPGGGYPGGGYPRGGGRYPQGGQQQRQQNGTTLYDAILLGSDEIMKKQMGRKAMVVLTDGVDHGSKVTLNEAIESAQRSDTLIYTIRFADDSGNRGGFGGPSVGFPGGGRRGGMGRPGGPQQDTADGKKILERIAHETGGAYFDVNGKMSLSRIYDRIEEDLRNQYSLGYTPEDLGPGFRRIKVTVKPKNLVVQAREGFYAK
ncbi:MAG TPA: VWA domain-containing protein [Bryobacteraceae bacterium]|nr:VWA domain-containing protein [Bryobacteraceae bacterium]